MYWFENRLSPYNLETLQSKESEQNASIIAKNARWNAEKSSVFFVSDELDAMWDSLPIFFHVALLSFSLISL